MGGFPGINGVHAVSAARVDTPGALSIVVPPEQSLMPVITLQLVFEEADVRRDEYHLAYTVSGR
jgi:hypothetical protein